MHADTRMIFQQIDIRQINPLVWRKFRQPVANGTTFDDELMSDEKTVMKWKFSCRKM